MQINRFGSHLISRIISRIAAEAANATLAIACFHSEFLIINSQLLIKNYFPHDLLTLRCWLKPSAC